MSNAAFASMLAPPWWLSQLRQRPGHSPCFQTVGSIGLRRWRPPGLLREPGVALHQRANL